MDPTLPTMAIQAFERATGLSLCFHDYGRSLRPFTDGTRNEHVNPVCRSVKTKRHQACIAFCAKRLRTDAWQWPNGAVKRCHAGVIELYLPVFIEEKLEWLFYAGVRRAAEQLVIPLIDNEQATHSGPWAQTIARLPELTVEQAPHYLELLRQLAARLVLWRSQMTKQVPTFAARTTLPVVNTRRSAIIYFLSKHHHNPQVRLADLAAHLHLSEDRAGHVVVELCDVSFSLLLARARIETAKGLLQLSDLPVREIAHQSGFGSRAQFFTMFKQHVGMTPAKWRAEPMV
jgi:AraC-like DNA-binding protein